jgi:hypothetical protein
LALTGRIKDWLKNPDGRLPVSCTVFVVEDSMEGEDGIEASWIFTSRALRYAAGVAVHLSKLRGKGTTNAHGMVASGPVSFARIYSLLNETLRRGGVYRNGAITLHLDYDHPDVLEFINMSRAELPWAKRCLDVDSNVDLVSNFQTRFGDTGVSNLLAAIGRGDLWLQKITYAPNGRRLYGNVCLETLLYHRGTCNIAHINLGALRPDELESAFIRGMEWMCILHPRMGLSRAGEGVYLSSDEDKQVGLGVLGLSNFLAIQGVKYVEFVSALELVTGINEAGRGVQTKDALHLAQIFRSAYFKAADAAKH